VDTCQKPRLAPQLSASTRFRPHAYIEGDVKPGKKDEFLKAWSSQILPLLKKQDGFVDEFLLMEEGSDKPHGLCFWKSKAQAEHYRRDVFPRACQPVEHLLTGTPHMRGFEVAAAETFNVAARKVA
jgi:heme-degrading monooxygenase HmoA